MRKLSRRAFGAVLAGVALSATARAQNAALVPAKRVALKGYDPVSYFTAGKPEQGSKEFTYPFDDATYWFKSAEQRDKFAADPERYAPQFDGYCAVQVSYGSKLEPDPEAWAIADDKLYVFGLKSLVPVFKRETASILGKAKDNWPKLQSPR